MTAVRQEWRVWVSYHAPFDLIDGVPCTPDAAEILIERRKALGYPEPGVLQTRTVTETPWREVDHG